MRWTSYQDCLSKVGSPQAWQGTQSYIIRQLDVRLATSIYRTER